MQCVTTSRRARRNAGRPGVEQTGGGARRVFWHSIDDGVFHPYGRGEQFGGQVDQRLIVDPATTCGADLRFEFRVSLRASRVGCHCPIQWVAAQDAVAEAGSEHGIHGAGNLIRAGVGLLVLDPSFFGTIINFPLHFVKDLTAIKLACFAFRKTAISFAGPSESIKSLFFRSEIFLFRAGSSGNVGSIFSKFRAPGVGGRIDSKRFLGRSHGFAD